MELNPHLSSRIRSIDLLRGIVMVLMVLDHTRFFFHETAVTQNPENLATTTPELFLTRWVTHLCAPVFLFLVGTSAYLYGQKVGSKKRLSRFLLSRGLFLIMLELTVFKFAWEFDKFNVNTFSLLVIWAIGITMLFLAAMIHLNTKLLLTIGLIIVLGHNLLDNVSFQQGTWEDALWKILHVRGWFPVGKSGIGIFVLFSVLPYFGLALLGYAMGKLYTQGYNVIKRKKVLQLTGVGCILFFVVLRFANIYGDPSHWSTQKDGTYTFLSFIATTKYPPSLLYVLMTIGPALIILSLTEAVNTWLGRVFVVLGRTPMYFYLWHLYIIHTLALLWGGINTHGLVVVYLATLLINIALYFLCKVYGQYKFAHPEKKWLSYL